MRLMLPTTLRTLQKTLLTKRKTLQRMPPRAIDCALAGSRKTAASAAVFFARDSSRFGWCRQAVIIIALDHGPP
jgi:hypothetical protein